LNPSYQRVRKSMIREFHHDDLENCKEIIELVWDFDGKIAPIQLSSLFKDIYVTSSLSESNFTKVVVINGKVEGFLFGKVGENDLIRTKYSGFLGRLKLIFELFSLRGVGFRQKMNCLNNMHEHDVNRKKIEPDKSCEVNLFAVNPDVQGGGLGKILMNSFVEHCKSENAHKITLETDKECNMGFYEHFGFKIKGDFYSSLQQEYSRTSGVSFVLELYL
ncbi:GNAT family N-acetyltransferase, partial [Vibrio vulnificus]